MRRFLFLVPFVFLAGCTYYLPPTISSSSINGQYEMPVKVASGHSSEYSVLLFGPFGDASVRSAIKDAMRNTDADTIANVYVDRKVFCFPICALPLLREYETVVFGTLVSYKEVDGVSILPSDKDLWSR